LLVAFADGGRSKVAKTFRIPAEEIKPLAAGFGSCLASDRITVDGMRVGYMYREYADDDADSGWRFFAGDESEEYSADPEHFAIYDVNTIANYDPTIIVWLETSPPCAFERDASSGHLIGVQPPDGESS
jgi:hypothetical protein